jgi:hypothetical protein
MAEGSDINADASPDAGKLRAEKAAQKAHKAKVRRLFWLQQARIWHWITGAATLVGMLLFAVTGITLVHAGQIEAKPVVTTIERELPAELLAQLTPLAETTELMPLPAPVAEWAQKETGARVAGKPGDWSSGFDVRVDLKRPGGDGWLSIDLETRKVIHETTDKGAISYLNDLHKGRDTGPFWWIFLDVFAAASILFCITGLMLLWMHAERRPPTWYIVGAGLLVPAMIAMFLIHV